MASLNGNNAYLEWNSVNISAYWTEELSHEASVDTEDITSGAGATHIERASKLIDRSMSFLVTYDDSSIASYVANLKEGTTATLTYGPESNTAGKPRFTGSMILESVTQVQSIQKIHVTFELSFVQAAAPTHTFGDGSTF